MKKIVSADPTELGIHPLAKRLPRWSKEDDGFINLVEDIRERGIDQPLLIDSENRILDGVERQKAAKQLQLKEVPVCLVPHGQELAVILQNLVARKHWTKGQLAYITFHLIQPMLDESKKRQFANLKNAKTPINSRECRGDTLEDLAASLGFSKPLYFRAQRIHEAFRESDEAIKAWEVEHPNEPEDSSARPEDLRAKFEPRILSGELSLEAVLKGLGGLAATKGQEKPESEQLELFEEGWETLTIRTSRYWAQFNEYQKQKAFVSIRQFIAQAPEELVEMVEKAVKQAKRDSATK
jgi:hypothetical protein